MALPLLAPRGTRALALAVLLGAVPLLSSSAPFSRSRWIAEAMDRGVRFSGGVAPLRPSPAMESLLRAGPAAPRRRPAGPLDVRVSFDILPPDPASAAQPETEAEPALAADPADGRRLLAGYQEDRFATGGARILTYAVSTDGGRHWREGLVPHLTLASGGPFQRASDPWVAFGPGHRAYFAALAFDETSPANGVLLSASGDGGASWGDPVTVHEGPADGLDDKDAVAVDGDPRSPFFSRVYVGWDIAPNDPRQSQTLVVAHSGDGGASFGPPVVLEPDGGNVGALPVVGPRGVVHAVWLHAVGGPGTGAPAVSSIEGATSTDGGESWSAPVEIAGAHAPGIAGLRTGEGLPAAAVDPRTGRVYVVWEDDRFTPGTPQIVMTSSPDGRGGWSAPRRVSDGPNGAASFTPAISVDSRGAVAVAYYSLRNNPQGSPPVLVDEYLTAGDPRKKAFGRGQRVSAASWDIRFAAMADIGFFLGDYQGLAAGANGFVPFWIATFAPSTLEAGARQPDAYVLAPRR